MNAVISEPRVRHLYMGVIAFAALVVFVGFAPTFYLRGLFHGPALMPLTVLHGIAFSAWIVLLLVQSLLVRTGNVRVHRRLGIAGALLAAGVVVLGVWLALVAAARGTIGDLVHAPPLEFLIVPLGQILIFGVLTGVAIALRRRPEVHRRLMIVATIHLTAPAMVRAAHVLFHVASPLPALIVTSTLVILCIVYDAVTRGRVHPVFAVVAPMTVLSFPMRILFSHTAAWHSIAAWLVRGVT
jgi:hypothetical protein